MEKRVILAFVLSFAVLYAFRSLFAPTPATEQPPIAQQPPPAVSNSVPPPAKASTRSGEAPQLPVGDIKAEGRQDLVFETELYTATLSNLGGVLKSFKLKGYSDGEGHPVELINHEAGAKVGWPLALVSGEKTIDEQLGNAQFAAKSDSTSLVLEFASNGLHARKALRFAPDNYLFTIETELTKDGKSIPYAVVWQGSFGDQSMPQDPARKNAVYQVETSFKRIALRSLKDQPQSVVSPRAGVE